MTRDEAMRLAVGDLVYVTWGRSTAEALVARGYLAGSNCLQVRTRRADGRGWVMRSIAVRPDEVVRRIGQAV